MNTKKCICIILFVLLPTLSQAQADKLGGTLVLVFGDSTGVLIGADSRAIINQYRISSQNWCKIHVFDNVVFANTGIGSIDEFVPAKIARGCYNRNESLEAISELYYDRFSHTLDSVSKRLKLVDSVGFWRTIGETCEAVWVGSDTSGFVVIWFQFWPRIANDGAVVMGSSRFRWHSNQAAGPYFKALGIDGINKQCVNGWGPQTFLKTYGYVPGLVKLIQMEIGFHPFEVGEPIDVLLYDWSGPHWQIRKKECQQCEICPPDTVKRN